jgi:hypothetical protein
MPDVETQLRDYLNEITSQRLEVDEIVDRVNRGPILTPVSVRRKRPAWMIGLAAALATVLIVGGGALLLRPVETDELPVVENPAPTAPAVTEPAPTLTTVAPAAPPAVEVAPAPTMTWSKVPAPGDVFTGNGRDDGWQTINDVVAAGPGLVAVGVDTSGGDEDAAVWYSEDGITWTRAPHDEEVFGGPGNETMTAITVGGPGLVAVGGSGPPSEVEGLHEISGQHAAVWYSADGIVWNRAPDSEAFVAADGAIVMKDVAPGGPGLVAVGALSHPADEPLAVSDFGGVNTEIDQDLDAVVWTSVDGLSWERLPHDDSAFGGDGVWHDMRAIAQHGRQLVAVGAAGFDILGPPSETLATAAVWTSTDGSTWTLLPFDDVFRYGSEWTVMNDVTSDGEVLTAVGLAELPQEPVTWSSTDGVAWTRVAPEHPPLLIPRLDGVAAQGEMLVTVGKGSDNGPAMVWFSTDGGVTWFDHPWDCEVMGQGPPDTRSCGTTPNWMNAVVGFESSFIAVGTSRFDAAVWVGTLDPLDD